MGCGIVPVMVLFFLFVLPNFAGISSDTFKMNCTLFASNSNFMLDSKVCQKQLLVLSAKQSEPPKKPL
jgi:hypothetical protein